MLSASKYDLARRCPASCALPQVDSTTEWSERGTEVHRFLERAQLMDRASALSYVPEKYRDLCEAIDFERLPQGLVAEVAIAIDVQTGKARELGRGKGRCYETVRETEIPGTLDVLGVSDEAVYVGDYKTGYSDQDAPDESGQFRTNAVAASRLYDRDAAHVEKIRIKDTGDVWRDRATLDAFDLDDHFAEMRQTWERVQAAKAELAAGSMPKLSTGPWCKWCPAFVHCPAQTALVKRLATGDEAREISILPLTPEMASRAYHRVKAAKQALKQIEQAIYAAAARDPIPLGDGRYLASVETLGNEVLDGDIAWRVITDVLDYTVADDAVSRTLTKKGLDAALAKHLPRGERAATKKRILDLLRQQGGATRKPKTEIREVTAKELKR